MAVAERDMDCYRGDRFNRVLRVQNIDLTTSTVRMQIREDVDAKKVYADLSLGEGLEIGFPDANTAVISINMENEITSKFPASGLVYDIQTETGGEILTIVRGSFNVTGDVTR